MNVTFKPYDEYLVNNPLFPKRYYISIAKKYNFLIYQKLKVRKPPVYLEESVSLLLDFIDYQSNVDYSGSDRCSPSELPQMVKDPFMPFSIQDIGSLAKLGILNSELIPRDKKNKISFSSISIDSFYPAVEFYHASLERLQMFRQNNPDVAVNDWLP